MQKFNMIDYKNRMNEAVIKKDKKSNNKIKKYIILYFFIFLFIILKMIIICNDETILIGDDLHFAYESATENNSELNLFNMCINQYTNLFSRYNCGLISHFLVKTINVIIPFLFNVHPDDFIITTLPIIKGSCYFFIIYLLSKFSQFYLKDKKIASSIMIALSFLIFFIAKCYGTDIFTANTNFYSYSLGLLFLCTFMHSIFKIIVKNKTLNKKELIYLILNAIILANCSTVGSFITGIYLALIITYNIFFYFLQKRRFVKDTTYEKLKFNLNKKFFSASCTFFLTLLCMWNFTSIYKIGLSGRTIKTFEIDIMQIKEYINVLINEYSFLLIYFIILIILFPLLLKRKLLRIKTINLSLLLQLSLLATLTGLFFSGKEENLNNYWIQIPTIKTTITIIATIPIILLLNNFSFLIRNIKLRKFIITSIFIILATTFSYTFLQEIINFKQTSIELKYTSNKHAVRYIEEKMLRFYLLKGETPILPRHPLSAGMTYEPFFLYENKICVNNHFMITRYYPIIYRDTKYIDKQLCFYEDAYEQFYKRGGRIYKFELENIKFSRLFDEDFVLNKNVEKNDLKEIYNNQPIKILIPQN